MDQEAPYSPSSFITDWAPFEIRRIKATQWRELHHLRLQICLPPDKDDPYLHYLHDIRDDTLEEQQEHAHIEATCTMRASFIAWEKASGRPVGLIEYYVNGCYRRSYSLGQPGDKMSGVTSRLWVHPNYLRKSIGSRLLKAGENWAYETNPALQSYLKEVDCYDPAVIQFYKSNGYKEINSKGYGFGRTGLQKKLMTDRGKPKPRSIDLTNYPKVEGLERPLQTPLEFYWVAFDAPLYFDDRAPLAGMQQPGPNVSWNQLYHLNFRWIVCLCSERPTYDPYPLKHLIKVELSDLADEEIPNDPVMEKKTINIIATKIEETLNHGEGVIVHSAGGRGRTGAVLGVTLRKIGYSSEEITEFLNAVHQARGKPRWWESPWQKELVERTAAD